MKIKREGANFFLGHTMPITSLAWEPLHKAAGGVCTRYASILIFDIFTIDKIILLRMK